MYKFTDITKVRLDQNPAGDLTMPSAGGGGGQSPPEYYTFGFTKGTPATLTITAPKVQSGGARSANAQPPSSAEETEQMMAMLKPLYSDLHMALKVQLQGRITETNAAFVDGATVTLLDMDFGKILADEAALKKLSSTQTQSVKEVQEMVKGIPGVKVDMQESISIKFR